MGMNHNPDKNVIDIKELNVSYNNHLVLDDVNLSLDAGMISGIVGPNGAGKSTLIKAIMGLVKINKGQIRLFRHHLNEVRYRVSYVPQRGSVDWNFPVSVFEAVLMGRYGKIGLFRRPGKADKQYAMHCLEKTGMAALKDRQIGKLSGGQQQKVFLARALAQDADLYFMDEPFAGVDASTENAIIELMKEMRQNGKTIVVVHHDLQTVKDYFDWLVLLNLKVIGSGPVHEVFSMDKLAETYGGNMKILAQVPQFQY